MSVSKEENPMQDISDSKCNQGEDENPLMEKNKNVLEEVTNEHNPKIRVTNENSNCCLPLSISLPIAIQSPSPVMAHKCVQTDVKHPLYNIWTLWYLEADYTKHWAELQNEICSVDMVEDFWAVYYHIKMPSQLKFGCDYSLFKKGIQPMWEDPANRNGGRWIIDIPSKFSDELNKLWLDVLRCLTGEMIKGSEYVNGAVVSIRPKGNKVAVWTQRSGNISARIGRQLRQLLTLPYHCFSFQLHQENINKMFAPKKNINL